MRIALFPDNLLRRRRYPFIAPTTHVRCNGNAIAFNHAGTGLCINVLPALMPRWEKIGLVGGGRTNDVIMYAWNRRRVRKNVVRKRVSLRVEG